MKQITHGEKPVEGTYIPAPNYRRDFWRSIIVDRVSQRLGHSHASIEQIVVSHRTTMASDMLSLLDQMDQAEIDSGNRSQGMEAYCLHRCEKIAGAYRQEQGTGPVWPHDAIAAAHERDVKAGKLRYGSYGY